MNVLYKILRTCYSDDEVDKYNVEPFKEVTIQ